MSRLREEGRTLLVTTQYVSEAEACDAVALISEGRFIAARGPTTCERPAIGGDMVTIETADPIDLTRCADAGVRRIEQRGPNGIRVTVDDAATSLPDIVEAITSAGGEVSSSRGGPAVLRRGVRARWSSAIDRRATQGRSDERGAGADALDPR